MDLLIFLKLWEPSDNIYMKKRVLITGGNKGIGLEITKLFLEHEYEVVVIGRDFSRMPQELSSKIHTVTFDLQNVHEIGALIEQIGAVNILINNAGVMHSLPYDDYPSDKRESIMKINIEAAIEMITHCTKGMIAEGGGRIVNIASIAGQIGHPDIWYGVTKAGVINFTKSFAKLLGEKGIVINCVAPSIVEGTDMFTTISPERKQDQLTRVLTHSFVEPKSVAEAVYWLATTSPKYINGTCIDINNGVLFR